MKKLILIFIFLFFFFPVNSVSASVKVGNTYHIKTALIQYIPQKGIRSEYPNAEVPDPVSFTQNILLPALNNASKYHGYNYSGSIPSLYYTLSGQDIFTDFSVPPQKDTGGNYDYEALFKKYELCDYAVNNDIGMVILWAHGEGLYEGGFSESAITGSKNIFTNGPVLPYCPQKTVVILGLNYGVGLAEAMESYGHHLERAFSSKLGINLYSSWSGTFDGRTHLDSYPGSETNQHCGGAHDAPNATYEYDRTNKSFAQTDCERWDHTDNSNNYESINCAAWGCKPDGYLSWWMQNMPGLGNALYANNSKIPNWWSIIGNPDNCANNPLGCGGVSTTPPQTSTLTLEINGNTKDNQSINFGKINLTAKLFNPNVNPNNGCPRNQYIIFKINHEKITEIAPCQPFEYQPPNPGSYVFTAEYLGNGPLKDAISRLDFVVLKGEEVSTENKESSIDKGQFSNISATLEKDKANFNFEYNGPRNQDTDFIISVGPAPENRIVIGSFKKSPVIETAASMNAYLKEVGGSYQCGEKLYWRVSGITSGYSTISSEIQGPVRIVCLPLKESIIESGGTTESQDRTQQIMASPSILRLTIDRLSTPEVEENPEKEYSAGEEISVTALLYGQNDLINNPKTDRCVPTDQDLIYKIDRQIIENATKKACQPFSFSLPNEIGSHTLSVTFPNDEDYLKANEYTFSFDVIQPDEQNILDQAGETFMDIYENIEDVIPILPDPPQDEILLEVEQPEPEPKTIIKVVVDGQEMDLNNLDQPLDLHLPGTEGQAGYFSIPVEIYYSDNTSRYLVLNFNYQPQSQDQCPNWQFYQNECTGCNQARSVERDDCSGETRISAYNVYDEGCASWCPQDSGNDCLTSCGIYNGENCTNQYKADYECSDYYQDNSYCSFTDYGERGDGCIP